MHQHPYLLIFVMCVWAIIFIGVNFFARELKLEEDEEEYDGYTGIIKFDEELSKMAEQIRSGKIKLPTPYFGYGAEEENKKYMTYKIGDRVKVKIAEGVEQCGKIVGKQAGFSGVLFQNGWYAVYTDTECSPITDPMDCLMVGDILECKGEDRRKVMGINGEVCFVSYGSNISQYSFTISLQELKNSGYTLSQPQSSKIQEAIDFLTKEGYKINK